jgi:hypothetical protein
VIQPVLSFLAFVFRLTRSTVAKRRTEVFCINPACPPTAALYGQITIKESRVEQTSFGDYRVLRINEAPKIDVQLVKSTEAPGGMREPGT